jgi:NAD(P)-dependent dehydrogenase (short-subunit alcohol dehydrogenase family)
MTPRTDVFREGLLVGKSAFITGGTSGINLAIAERLVRAGASVAILGRKADKAEAAAEQLRAVAYGGAKVLPLHRRRTRLRGPLRAHRRGPRGARRD